MPFNVDYRHGLKNQSIHFQLTSKACNAEKKDGSFRRLKKLARQKDLSVLVINADLSPHRLSTETRDKLCRDKIYFTLRYCNRFLNRNTYIFIYIKLRSKAKNRNKLA